MDLAPVPCRDCTVPLDPLTPAVVSAARAWSVPGTVEVWRALQMRYDLLREQFQVLQVVKHRVQEQMLRASPHDFG